MNTIHYCVNKKIYKIEENSNIESMPRRMSNFMYGVFIEEHNVPPKWDTFAKCKVDWAGEFHLEYFDSSKNSEELYWNEDLIVMKN